MKYTCNVFLLIMLMIYTRIKNLYVMLSNYVIAANYVIFNSDDNKRIRNIYKCIKIPYMSVRAINPFFSQQ